MKIMTTTVIMIANEPGPLKFSSTAEEAPYGQIELTRRMVGRDCNPSRRETLAYRQ